MKSDILFFRVSKIQSFKRTRDIVWWAFEAQSYGPTLHIIRVSSSRQSFHAGAHTLISINQSVMPRVTHLWHLNILISSLLNYLNRLIFNCLDIIFYYKDYQLISLNSPILRVKFKKLIQTLSTKIYIS